MDRKQILAMFEKRAEELIKKWPATDDPLKLPQAPPGADIIIKAAKALHEVRSVTSVLDLGCGLGRWARFWMQGIGAKRYTGIEPVRALAAEAEARAEPLTHVEIMCGELIELDQVMPRGRRWDLGFTFTVLEHVPPSDIEAVAEILKRRTRRLMLVEMVQATPAAGFCEYVFKHDYQKLFGPWKFSRMVDANKALMVF